MKCDSQLVPSLQSSSTYSSTDELDISSNAKMSKQLHRLSSEEE